MSLGIVNKQFITQISSFLDDRDILPGILDVQNERPSLTDFMELLGKSTVSTEPFFNYFVNTPLFSYGVVLTAPAGSGPTETVVLTAATAAACQAGDIAYLPVNGKAVYVFANNNGTLTLQSVDGSNITPADAPVGDIITFPTNASGEGASGPGPRRWSKTLYSNVTQSFGTKYEITDIQKVSALSIPFNGQPYYLPIQAIESGLYHKMVVSFAMLMSQYSGQQFGVANPSLLDAAGNPVQTTRGLDQWVQSYGIPQALSVAGKVDNADYSTLNTTLDADRAPHDYFVYVGSLMDQYHDDWLNALNNGSSLSQAGRFVIEGGDELNLGITNYRIYGRDFHRLHLATLDHAQTINFANSYNIATSAYFVPNFNINTIDGGLQPCMSIRYQSGDGTNLKYWEVFTGGLAPTPTSDQKVFAATLYSTQGLQVLGANWFAKLHP